MKMNKAMTYVCPTAKNGSVKNNTRENISV